ncbi:Ty3/Gypsy family RNase HI domain-containing protein, partial [Acinetobacter baumannii]|uniref:Ty3/Gypsy family RNase HI domain-containing protein n=1 Tax=Acinetobacter baumannii TaxID=470 RepID=UPI00339268CF
NYATSEKECLALVWAVQKFQLYLYGSHFTVQVDHQPLSFLATSKSLNARLMRWALLLQAYSFQLEHIPGKDNHGADFLSRHPATDSSESPLRADAPAFIPAAAH